MYMPDPDDTYRTWLARTLDFEGFGSCPVYQTAHEDDPSTVGDMVLSVIANLTYPEPAHPYPKALAGIHWSELVRSGKDTDRRLEQIIALTDEGLIIDQGGLLSLNPDRYDECFDRAGYWPEGVDVPEGEDVIMLTPLGQQMFEQNSPEDLAEYVVALMGVQAPGTAVS